MRGQNSGVLLVCCFLVFAAVDGVTKIKKSEIVALWLFDEGSGKILKDSSGNKKDGILI